MVPRFLQNDGKNAAGRGGSGGGGWGGGGGAVVADVEGEQFSLPLDSCDGDGDGGGGLLKISVIAHSMGGLVAVKAALEEPVLFERVR